MEEITDFRFKLWIICAQHNRTGRIYDVIGHLEVDLCFDPYHNNSNGNHAKFF